MKTICYSLSMIASDEIQKQLRKFNLMGYADSNVKYEDNGKNGKILTLTKGDWRYEDEFYGGEPYSGNETIWFKDKDIFRCVYRGKVAEGSNFSDVYDFLRKALKKGPSGTCVHRGPEKYAEGNLTYKNSCKGSIEEFTQTEKIYLNEREVYTAFFIGGRTNIQKE